MEFSKEQSLEQFKIYINGLFNVCEKANIINLTKIGKISRPQLKKPNHVIAATLEN